MLQIVADENIPFVAEAFGATGRVHLYPGQALVPEVVRDADVLLVRSVTPVGPALLEGSRVRFVGSATIGTDHVDEAYLQARGIPFAHAPGSNAVSVVEYMFAGLLTLAERRGDALRGKTLGIVGYGNIGARLAARAEAFGLHVLANDPPLAAQAEAAGRRHDFVALETVLAEADVVTLHVPLIREGPYRTRHLIDAAALGRMRPGAWLVNSCRGAVVDNAALSAALAAGRPAAAMLDVWEGEPRPDATLVRRVALGTPHIAGYSFDGKVQGTVQLYEALVARLGLPETWDPEAAFAPGPEDHLALTPPDEALGETAWLAALVRQMYDIAADDARLRRLAALPEAERGDYFNRLRKEYPRRRTFSRHTLPEAAVPAPLRFVVSVGLDVRLLPEADA